MENSVYQIPALKKMMLRMNISIHIMMKFLLNGLLVSDFFDGSDR